MDAGAVDSLKLRLLQDRLSEAEAAASLRLIRQSINQLQGLELTLISAAQRANIGVADGLVGAAWVARESRQGGASAARNVQLTASLEELPQVGQALGEGSISVEHAEVIATAARQLPADLTTLERDGIETALTEQAKSVDPATLRKVSGRVIQLVGRSVVEVDAQENRLVKTAEEKALDKTRLSLHDNHDGTISGHFVVPTFAGNVLHKVVQQITAPRRQALRAARADRRSWTRVKDSEADWSHQYGLALVEVLEHLPTDHLHSKVAATVMVTMDVDQLRDALKVAGTDVGEQLSAEKARQVACNAGIVPAVLNGLRSRSIWGAAAGCSPMRSAPCLRQPTIRAPRPGVIGRMPGRSCTTNDRGIKAARPIWTKRYPVRDTSPDDSSRRLSAHHHHDLHPS